MGLLTGYQDDADRLARQDKNLARTYNHDLRGIKTEAAPHETVVKDYNAQVDGFNNSAIHKADGSLWEIVGFYGSASGGVINQPVRYEGGPLGFTWSPEASTVRRPGYEGATPTSADAGMYLGAGASSQGGYGFYRWGSSPLATLRDASGAPVRAWQDSWDNVNPVQAYATRNDRPFVAPVTQSQIDTAKSADAKLTELGTQGEAINAEAGATRGLLTKKSDRIADDIEMNAGRLREEVAPTQQSGSVFDQNMAGIHQTIADWLK